MGDLVFNFKLNEDDALMFKRAVRTFLDRTFILGDRDEVLYDFIVSGSNHNKLNEYFDMSGYRVMLREDVKVAMLQQAGDVMDEVGFKRANLVKFSGKEVHLLLVLWLLYLERMGYANEVYVTVEDIVDKCSISNIELKNKEFKEGLKLFKRFSLINFRDSEERLADSKILLYPSLMFALDMEEFNEVVNEKLESINTEDDEFIEEEFPEGEEEFYE